MASVIQQVQSGSPACKTKIAPGDVLISVNGNKIVDVLDYPGNKVYVIKGTYEYMVPAVRQFVLSTDLEHNRMQIQLIEGMRTDEN